MINSPGLAGPPSHTLFLPALPFLPTMTLGSLHFISSDLLLSLNNKYPVVDTFGNQRHPDSAEIGLTFM